MFSKQSRNKDGFQYECKGCVHTHYAAHAKERGASQRVYALAHKEEIAAYKRTYALAHKEELSVKAKAYYTVNKEQLTVKQTKRMYGLTPTQYDELMAKGCAVCGTMENLCIDHNHACCAGQRTCGKCVRGVLCNNHNRGEGYFKSVDELLAMVAYLMQFENVIGAFV